MLEISGVISAIHFLKCHTCPDDIYMGSGWPSGEGI